MITPDEARRIAEEHPNQKVLEYIHENEQRIEAASNNGMHETLLISSTYTESELVRHFRERGFSVFKERRWCGCWQTPAYYIHW